MMRFSTIYKVLAPLPHTRGMLRWNLLRSIRYAYCPQNVCVRVGKRITMKQARIKKTKKTALLGAMLLLCVTGVSAAVFSNLVQGQFTLISNYAMELAWDSGAPWTDTAFSARPYAADLVLTNLDPDAISVSGASVLLEIYAPNDCNPTMFEVVIEGTTIVMSLKSGETRIFEGGKLLLGGIDYGTPRVVSFVFTFNTNAEIGSYDFTIWVDLP